MTRPSCSRVAARHLSAGSVKVEVIPEATEKAQSRFGGNIAVGKFLSSVPLFRVMDGEEVRDIWDTGEIKGGSYSVEGERAFGAQWGADRDKVAKWGVSQQGKRLGHELFVAEIDGNGRVFAHLTGADGELKPDSGTISIDPDFCYTGLGCSVHASKGDVRQWYAVGENGKIRKVSADEVDDMINELGLKPRDVELWYGEYFGPSDLPGKLKRALRYETVQYGFGPDGRPLDRREKVRRRRELQATPMESDRLGRLLFSYLGRGAIPWWESSSGKAFTQAHPHRSDGIDSFSLVFGVMANTAIPFQGADMVMLGEAKVKMVLLYIPPTAGKRGNWEQIWAPWGKADVTFLADRITVSR